MTDYEREYRRCPAACGEPFSEFVAFFGSLPAPRSVLDLGCGQGRGALVAARQGHDVVGIDIAGSGIAQLERVAAAEGLRIRCAVADIEAFRSDRRFDVVVLDRVLHMLPSEEWRLALLRRAQGWVAAGGHMLLADTRRNRALIRGCFDGDAWQTVLGRRDVTFVRRSEGAG